MNKNISSKKPRNPRPTVEVLCAFCGKRFLRQAHHHNYAVKIGQDEFCSKECKNNNRVTSVSTSCTNCSKSLTVCFGEYTKSINKHFFCNSKCSASFNNRHRGKPSTETKIKTSQSVSRYLLSKGIVKLEKKFCIICNKEFQPKFCTTMCCSKKCGNIYQFGVAPLSQDALVNSIVNYFAVENSTPGRRKFNGAMYYAAKRFFGSWNKAIESCGLTPNGNSPKNVKIKCRDDHFARSISEKTIDNWLFNKGIKHELEKPYQEGHYTCDFYLPDYDLWIEYFGLAGAFKEYDDTILVKKELVKKYNLNFISLFPKDLYPELNLDKIILL